jgi:RND family efflux transporter MFP subunit
LFAKVSGYVADVPVDIGSRVKQGEVLLRISVPEMEDELRQAQAELQAQEAKVRAIRAKAIQAARMVEIAKAEVSRENARHDLDAINLERKQELHAGNAIPKQALDEALSAHEVTEAQLQIAKAQVAGAEAEKQAVDADAEVAQAQVAVAQANLGRLKTLMEYSSIKAPFDGVITMRNVDRGAFVRSAAEGTTTPLLRISLTDRIRLTLEVPEVDAMLVHIGTKVQIDVRASGEDPFPGVVSRIAGAFKPDTRTMQVEVDIDNHNGRLAPGMYARVVVMLESKAQAMVVPSKAIRVRGKETIVLVAVDGIAKAKTVEVGYDDGIWAEILSGLDAEEKVISATRGTVAPGVAVKLVTVGSS